MFCGSASAADKIVPSQHTPHKILILGDSLSAGYGLYQAETWVKLLQDKIAAQQLPYQLINAAISGETTDGGLARLPALMAQHQPRHVYIELGANDGLQGHAIGKIKKNLAALVTLVQQANATVSLQAIRIPTNYGARYNQLFNQAFNDVAQKHDVPLVPFFLTDIALQPQLMQADQLHPNAAAQPLIAEFMWQHWLAPLLDE